MNERLPDPPAGGPSPGAAGARVLVVSRDGALIDGVRAALPDREVVALTEATTRLALDAGSELLDGIGLAVLDGTVSGRLRLGLYARLRPDGDAGGAAVIFSRSGFATARDDGPRGVDLYLPGGATAREVAWWSRALIGAPRGAPSRALGAAVAGQAATQGSATQGSATHATGAHASAARAARADAAPGLPVPLARSSGTGWVARAGLWGVATALLALMLSPAADRAAFGDSVREQVGALLGGASVLAGGAPGPDASLRAPWR